MLSKNLFWNQCWHTFVNDRYILFKCLFFEFEYIGNGFVLFIWIMRSMYAITICKVIFYLQGFQLWFYIGSESFQKFVLPVHGENYLRVPGAKTRWKYFPNGSQSWIVFPFSVFYRVVSCWLSVLRGGSCGSECCALIGRLPALLLVDSNCSARQTAT